MSRPTCDAPDNRLSHYLWDATAVRGPSFSYRYFTSRPELLSRVGGAGVSKRSGVDTQAEPPPAAAAAAITAAAQRAMIANPTATSRLIATGINRANNSANSRSGNPSAASNSDLVTPANVGRVAAAAQALSTTSASPPPKSASPPVAPRADSSRLLQQKVSPQLSPSSSFVAFFIVEHIYALRFLPCRSIPFLLLGFFLPWVRYAEVWMWG